MDIETPVVSVEIDPPKKHRFTFNPKIAVGVVAGLTASVIAAVALKGRKSEEATFEGEFASGSDDPFAPVTTPQE